MHEYTRELTVDRHVSSFQLLDHTCNLAVTLLSCVFSCTCTQFLKGVPFLSHKISLSSNLVEEAKLFSKLARPFCLPQAVWLFPLFHILVSPWYGQTFHFRHSGGCVAESPYDFNLHFMVINEVEHFFIFFSHWSSSLWTVYSSLLSFFSVVCCRFLTLCRGFLHALDMNVCLVLCVAITFPTLGFVFLLLICVFWWILSS